MENLVYCELSLESLETVIISVMEKAEKYQVIWDTKILVFNKSKDITLKQ